ncbi:MAG: hypothetical protein LBK13_03565 [Spirochaetales bacterium]|jgi:hypothetical protein|nr:hypothetical protein [Spirochaetales bacterium]
MDFHPISEIDAQTSTEVLAKARKLYERESLNMRLKALREKYGVKQGMKAAVDTAWRAL